MKRKQQNVRPCLLALAILASASVSATAATLTPAADGDLPVAAAIGGRSNLALSSGGGVAFSSSDLTPDYGPTWVNDGVIDQSGSSWMPATTGSSEYVGVKFPSAIALGAVVWHGQTGYNGRSGGTWSLQYTTDPAASDASAWTEIGTYIYSEGGCASPMPRSLFAFPAIQNVTGVRLVLQASACGIQLAVQELEAYSPVSVPPTIDTKPAGGTATAGDDFTFKVVASGAESFQWRKDGVIIPAATGSSYTISNVKTNDAGAYTVVVANGNGSVTSEAVVLTVTAAPEYATYREAVLADKPIHYYPLDETAGTAATDLGALAAAGVYSAGITLGQPSASSRMGLSPHFDGNAGTFVDLGKFHPGDSVTVEAWASLDTDARNNSWHAIVARWDGSFELDFGTSEGANLFLNNDAGTFGQASSPTPSARGQWHHLVGVYAGEVASLWVDGQLTDSRSLPGVLRDQDGSSTTIMIGATRDGLAPSGFNFKGFIDEVAIYDHALSAAQIRNHYRTSISTAPPTLGIESAVILSWPAFPPGYVLQRATAATGPYVTVTDTPVAEGGQFKLALPTDPAERYFRLVKP